MPERVKKNTRQNFSKICRVKHWHTEVEIKIRHPPAGAITYAFGRL